MEHIIIVEWFSYSEGRTDCTAAVATIYCTAAQVLRAALMGTSLGYTVVRY